MDAVEAAVAIAKKEVEAQVRDVCLLSAPTGCASFQLKFGASTLHRAYGVGIVDRGRIGLMVVLGK